MARTTTSPPIPISLSTAHTAVLILVYSDKLVYEITTLKICFYPIKDSKCGVAALAQ